MAIYKFSRLQHFNALVARDFEQVFITTYYDHSAAGQSAGKKFVIVWIFADWIGQGCRCIHSSILDDVFQDRLQVNDRTLLGQDFTDPLVLI